MNVQRSAILAYSAAQMYEVIRGVQHYPEFLNWCSESKVENDSEFLQVAQLKIIYGRLKLAFTTENTLTPNELIEMRLVSGPFKDLSGQWSIQAFGETACKVSLDMNFTFDNPITHRLFGKVFQKVVTAQVDAFEKRARQIYGV